MVELAFKFGPAEYFSLMVLGLIGAVVLASGSLIKAIAMIVLGLLLGLVGTDVNSGVARFSFDIPELADGIGFVSVAMGVFGFAEIIVNLEHKEKREVFTSKVGRLMPSKEEFSTLRRRCCAEPHLGRSSACCPAVAPCSQRSLRTRSKRKSRAIRNSVRQRQHPRRCSARVRQQRGRADFVHPDADAGNSTQCGDGVDGRRDDDPQHPTRPAGDVEQSVALLGTDRIDVDRQPDPGGAEPAADRHLGSTAEGSVPAAVSGDSCVLRHRRVLDQQQPVRCHGDRRCSACWVTFSTSCAANPRR